MYDTLFITEWYTFLTLFALISVFIFVMTEMFIFKGAFRFIYVYFQFLLILKISQAKYSKKM